MVIRTFRARQLHFGQSATGTGQADQRRAIVVARPYALSLSLNLVKLFDRAPELALLTSPEDDHTEREDNQER